MMGVLELTLQQVMGLTCKTSTHHSQDYEFLRTEAIKPFGQVRVFRDAMLDRLICTKQIYFKSQIEVDEYSHTAEIARQKNSVPLIRINRHFQCRTIQCAPHVYTIQFNYHSTNFEDLIRQKAADLSFFVSKHRRDMQLFALDKIKLNDYEKINVLSQPDRSYISLFFYQAEILRMIDHLAGCVLFLAILNWDHGGLRPENILIDEEGRYLLADRQLFKLETNYQRGLRDAPGKIYVSPQQFKSLKQRQTHPTKSPLLSDIFSIGLIALEMANLNDRIDKIYDFGCWRANNFQINRLLAQAKQRYSDKLIEILQGMLALEESDRLDLDKLIRVLHPLLQADYKMWDSVFLPQAHQTSIQSMSAQNQKPESHRYKPTNRQTTNLLQKLAEIEQSYHRVMSSQVLNNSKIINQQSIKRDEDRIISRLKQVRLAQSRGNTNSGGKSRYYTNSNSPWDASPRRPQ